jgi:hypothetical protein
MSLLHSIPFGHAIHFLACVTLDLISLSSVPLVSKITLDIHILDKIQSRCLYLSPNINTEVKLSKIEINKVTILSGNVR